MKKTSTPSPVYLLAGGPGSRRRSNSLLNQVLANGGHPEPSIAYIGAASDDHPGFFSMISNHLRDGGAGQVTLVPLAGQRANRDQARIILESADMVFISGGDVEAGMEVLKKRNLLSWLHHLYQGGKPFFGLSAGSIILARQWIRWDNPHDDTTARLFPCMGLAPLLVDTHGEDDQWGELQALLRMTPEGTLGYGIPTGAGLRVGPDATVEAMGTPVHRYARRNGRVLRLADLMPWEALVPGAGRTGDC